MILSLAFQMQSIQKAITGSEDDKVLAAKANADAAVEIVGYNIEWLDQKKGTITKWLSDKYKDDSDGAAAVTVSALGILFCLIANRFV